MSIGFILLDFCIVPTLPFCKAPGYSPSLTSTCFCDLRTTGLKEKGEVRAVKGATRGWQRWMEDGLELMVFGLQGPLRQTDRGSNSLTHRSWHEGIHPFLILAGGQSAQFRFSKTSRFCRGALLYKSLSHDLDTLYTL